MNRTAPADEAAPERSAADTVPGPGPGTSVAGPDRSTSALVAYIAPLALLLLSSSFFPWPVQDPESALEAAGQTRLIWLLAGQSLLVGGAILFWFRQHGSGHSWRISPWAPLLGLVGVVLWIGLARIDGWLVQQLGLEWLVPKRAAFDPFQQIPDPQVRAWFLAIRFSILALVVPFAEEIFLRGWLARWFGVEGEWWSVSLKRVGRDGLLAITAYAVLAHPMEAVAAIVWFNLVSWWMKRSGSLADCIVIHATTNLALGLWILRTGEWNLW